MKVVLSTLGKFHTFDLARQLYQRSALEAVFTGYPRFKLRHESLPAAKIHPYPWIHTPYMALAGRLTSGSALLSPWEWLDRVMLDRHVARQLPPCDVFVGLSSSALFSGRVARRRGARFVCDRGSTHIRVQDELLRAEHERWGVPFEGINPRIIEREEAEYEEADCITVPSSFNLRSFIAQGVSPQKLNRLPYGVDLDRFYPTQAPALGRFDILFAGAMSLRKGVPYLLQAYRELQHPAKSLSFAGAPDRDLIERMQHLGLWADDVRVLGHLDQAALRDAMSRSHVLVLPSIEEGLALVQAQAMACACPVIGTTHTGAEDIFTDGDQGYIVPAQDAHALANRLQLLADQPDLRQRLSQKALFAVRQAGGWRNYGDQAMALYQELAAMRHAADGKSVSQEH